MNTLVEKKKRNQSIYILDSNNNFNEIVFPTLKKKEEGIIHYIIQNDNITINKYSYYITYDSDLMKEDTRDVMFYAFRLLAIFEKIISKDLIYFSNSDTKQLMYFIKGDSFKTDDINYILNTHRSNSTINEYLNFYRAYLRNMKIYEHPLLDLKYVNRIIKNERIQNADYKYKLKTNKSTSTKKPILTKKEFILVWKANSEEKDPIIRQRNEIILILLYGYGSRIGSVLSLTEEDISLREMEIDSTLEIDNITGEVYAEKTQFAILTYRNRRNNIKGCNNKNLIAISSASAYQSSDYDKIFIGKFELPIDLRTYDHLMSYITQSKLDSIKHKRISTETLADSVKFYKLSKTNRKQIMKNKKEMKKYENHYIFINKYGGRLRPKAWNDDLKKLFLKAGVPIDKIKKHLGLSHRMRHSYATNRLKQSPSKIVSKELGHTNSNSIDVYFNPSTEDIVQIKNDLNVFESLWDSIEKEENNASNK